MLSHRSAAASVRRTCSLPSGPASQRRCSHKWSAGFSDWATKQDPNFLKYQRRRFLNTRAKLLKSIQRRKQWDLSGSFFTPKHIRLASHCNNRHRGFGRWQTEADNGDNTESKSSNWSQSDGYELSAREKSWKQQMEHMRKRLQDDPYEAVFGKRFEPFWGPLVPTWMRSEWKMPEIEPVLVEKSSTSNKSSKRGQEPASYTAYSSTSWNSWTNKCKKTEWDNASGQIRHYEYDPITNRMVQTAADRSVSTTESTGTPAIKATNVNPAGGAAKTEQQTRKAIPIPRFAESEVQQPAIPSQPVASHRVEDTLTARSIRAAMGKARTNDDAQVNILLGEDVRQKSQPAASSHWDHAEQFVTLEQEVEGLKAEKARLLQRERRAFHFADLARRLEVIQQRIAAAELKLEKMNAERISMSAADVRKVPTEQPRDKASALRPAVDRMQSKPVQKVVDVDDSAAHESTEASTLAIPKAWSNQADLLQADRVERTAGRDPTKNEETINPKHAERSANLAKANEMLQAEVDRQKLIMGLHEERHRGDAKVLRGELIATITSGATPEALQAKVVEMQQAETKYKAKISALKQELDIAYKQSSRHADEFRDQIKRSEQRNLSFSEVEAKYKQKIARLREDLDMAFKQSSQHADEFRNQISRANSAAEGQGSSVLRLTQATERKYKAQIAALKEELDLAYEQSSRHGDEFRRQIQNLEAKLTAAAATSVFQSKPTPQRAKLGSSEHDRALVREIRNIYEDQYGIIGRELQSSTAETLDECLDDYDNHKSYKFKGDNLEAELAGSTAAKPQVVVRSGKPTPSASPVQGQALDDLSKAYEANEKKSAYAFKSDNLEAEIQHESSNQPTAYATHERQIASPYKGVDAKADEQHDLSKAYEANEKNAAYAFKGDNLETELGQTKKDDLIKDAAGVYHFREDGLERELKRPGPTSTKPTSAYQFRHDDLESELKIREVPLVSTDTTSYNFKHDGLEKELATKHTQPGASASPTELDKKSYAFKQDGLEAELAAQTSAEAARQNRASLRQRITEDFKDVAKMLTEVRTGQVYDRRHPIDGMTPAVGNYASPTGFVNHDPVVPFQRQTNAPTSAKIRREEPVFSGMQRVSHGPRFPVRNEHDMHRGRARRRRKVKRVLKIAALIAAVAAIVTYVEGAGLEAQQASIKNQVQREAWQQIAREYERSGERGILKAMSEMQTADTKRGSGLFWK